MNRAMVDHLPKRIVLIGDSDVVDVHQPICPTREQLFRVRWMELKLASPNSAVAPRQELFLGLPP